MVVSTARNTFKSSAAGLVLALSALTFTGPAYADDATCTPHDIDLGNGQTVKGGCGPLKIAFLTAATNNTYLQAGIQAAKDAAEKHGATLEVFDSNWSATTQYNQAQNIITNGEFQAILAEMNDPNQSCTILSKDAPAKGIIVSVANGPLCDRATKEGDELWQPGTLTFVGGAQSLTSYREWLTKIAEQNPGAQKIAMITGPELGANSINFDAAMKDVLAKNAELQLVATVRTDYSVLQGNQKALPLLQANPDLSIIISNYSDVTRGLIQAVKQAGMEGKVKIYDFGGNKWAFQAVANGEIEATRMMTPYEEMFKGVEAIAKAWKGESVDRYIPLTTADVTKDNIDQFKPEY